MGNPTQESSDEGNEGVDSVNGLFRAGAISNLERLALLGTLARDVARDASENTARNHLVDPQNSADTKRFEEYGMNPKSIIESIERTRAVMQAQVDKLNELAPTMPRVRLAADQDNVSASTLLNTAVRAHLQGAVDVLNVIADVEAQVRMMANEEAHASNPRREPQILDAEVVVVTREDPKE